MLLSHNFYKIESQARNRIQQRIRELELTSDSEDSGLEHYMNREEFQQLATHNYDIGVCWSKRFSKKLSKKILVKLWELSYFLEDEELRGKLLVFITEESKKYHLQDDCAIAASFASKEYFLCSLSDKLWKQPQYLNNLIGNKYTLKDNEEHLDLFEIIKRLNLRYGIKAIAKPRKAQRHKGYRDHGSLSDETSRVLKEEWRSDQQNYDLINKKIDADKEREDTIEFLKGFLQ